MQGAALWLFGSRADSEQDWMDEIRAIASRGHRGSRTRARALSAGAARNLSVSRPRTAAASCHRDRTACRNAEPPNILTYLGFKLG